MLNAGLSKMDRQVAVEKVVYSLTLELDLAVEGVGLLRGRFLVLFLGFSSQNFRARCSRVRCPGSMRSCLSRRRPDTECCRTNKYLNVNSQKKMFECIISKKRARNRQKQCFDPEIHRTNGVVCGFSAKIMFVIFITTRLGDT